MARKIKGWVDQFGVPPHQREQNENITVQDHKWLSGDLRCTLVIGDERVFTESEVRVIMQKMSDGFEAEMRTSVQFPGRLEVDESVVHDRIDEACNAFGIVLDPA